MDSPPIRGAVTNTGHVDRSNASETTTNERGVKQDNGTRSRLASIRQSVWIAPTEARDVTSLAYGGDHLRTKTGTDMTVGRFRNMVADALPFVGKTTYGNILKHADNYIALMPQLGLTDKMTQLSVLKAEIDAWQQGHGDKANTAKGQAIADLGQAVADALGEAAKLDLDQTMLARLGKSLPVVFEAPKHAGDPMKAGGPLTGPPLDRLAKVLGTDVFTRGDQNQPKNVDSGQGYPVSEVFKKDFIQRADRLTMHAGGEPVYDRNAPKAGDAAAALLSLTGGDKQVASSLSHYVGQHVTAGLQAVERNLLRTAEGGSTNILQPTQPQFGYSISRNEPAQQGGEVTYTINVEMRHPIQKMGSDIEDFMTFTPQSGLALGMQFEVGEQTLKAGTGAFTMTQPPGFVFALQLDVEGTLNQRGF